MKFNIPTSSQVAEALAPLKHAQLVALAEKADVSITTLFGIRRDGRPNPGIETVRRILKFIGKV